MNILYIDRWWFFIVVFSGAYIFTAWYRKYALRNQILDIPNDRSSHVSPTPRGGGVSIVLIYLCSLLGLGVEGFLSHDILIALLGAGAGVALVGLLDDYRHIAVAWRLFVHFVCVSWALVWMASGIPQLSWEGGAYVLATFYLVWLLNLYNFMDGIDGIASIEAITVLLSVAFIYLISGLGGINDTMPILLLAAAVGGFSVWNFPKARVFMGDAGSGFLGVMLGLLSIHSLMLADELFFAWLIMLGVFIVDASLTLLVRIVRKQRFYEPHCIHAYQHAARRYNSHVVITVFVGIINLIWLFPLAILVSIGKLGGVDGILIAYIPLFFLAMYYGAGRAELV